MTSALSRLAAPLWQGTPMLAQRCAGRDNNFNLLRLFAASVVIFAHSFDLGLRPAPEWVVPIIWNRVAGNHPVQLFLVISGFLVSKSFIERRHLASFFLARALRIYPALVCAVALAVVLAAISSTLPLNDFLAHPDTRRYILFNAIGYNVSHTLPGAYGESYLPTIANGPLWTLPMELNCYVLLAALGSLGLLLRPAWFAAAVIAMGVWFAYFPLHFPMWVDIPGQFVGAFALGSLAYVFRRHIPLSVPLLLALIALDAFLWHSPVASWLFTVTLAYAALVIAYAPRLYFAAYNRLGDYSYGMYVYAFPLQQTLACNFPMMRPEPFLFWSLALALPLAMLSWHFVEHPALRLKWRARPVATLPV